MLINMADYEKWAPANNEPQEGPYISMADFAEGVLMGIYGPDEATFWVYIDDYGNLQETPTHSPNGKLNLFPPTTICVAYHAA